MGWAGLQELLRYPDQYNVTILARKSKKNIKKLTPLEDKIRIVWGDLMRYEDVLAGVTGADIVLHVATGWYGELPAERSILAIATPASLVP